MLPATSSVFPSLQQVRSESKKSVAATCQAEALEVLKGIASDNADGHRLIAVPQKPIDNWHFYVPRSMLSCLGIHESLRHKKIKINDEERDYRWFDWVQSGIFHFEQNDTIYDSKMAYENIPWSETCRHFKRFLRIESAIQGSPFIRKLEVTKSNIMPEGMKQRLNDIWNALPRETILESEAQGIIDQATGKKATTSLQSLAKHGGCTLKDLSTPRDPGQVVVVIWKSQGSEAHRDARLSMDQDSFVRLLITGSIPESAQALPLG